MGLEQGIVIFERGQGWERILWRVIIWIGLWDLA